MGACRESEHEPPNPQPRSQPLTLGTRYLMPTLKSFIFINILESRRIFQRSHPTLLVFSLQQQVGDPPDSPLPEAVATGAEPFLVVGAIAGN